MNKYKIIGLISLCVCSFYYTEKIAFYMIKKDGLYKEIESYKIKYDITAIQAFIEDDYIVPGISGIEIDVLKSFHNMKKANKFNEDDLVYKEVVPMINLDNHKEKIIKNGNAKNNKITLILENDNTIINYFISNNIKANLLIDYKDFDVNSFLEQINNDKANYKKLDSIMKNNSINNRLCVINSGLKAICKENDKYLIEAKEMDNNSFYNIKKNLVPGDIILIKKGVNIEYVKLLIGDILYKNINIVYLSDLIKESRN